MEGYILAHDVGTGGNKAVLVTPAGEIRGSTMATYETSYPHPDWAEQNPEDWWQAVATSTRELLQQTGVSPKEILAVVCSTQMLGVVPVTAQGQPLRPGIIWLDGRAREQARQVMARLGGPWLFAQIVGAALGGKDVLPKYLWLKQHEPEVFARTDKFLDVGGYLLLRATGKMAFEWSAASVTGLFNMKRKEWDRFLMRFFGLPPEKFPPLYRSFDQVGGLRADAAADCGLLEGTPVFAGAGDAPSAAVGSGAVGEGEGHIYLGTSGWVGVVQEANPTGKHGIAAIQSADPKMAFLIAETETAGACLQWIADQFYREEQQDPRVGNVFRLMDEAVEKVPPGSGYLLFTPWMYGERVPVSDAYVRSTFVNLSYDHTREHMLRAVYEGVAYNLRWMLELMSRSFGYHRDTIRVMGGGARGAPWMQIIADVTGKRIETVPNPQAAGAVGCALIAAIGLGIYPDFAALKEVIRVERTFAPRPENRAIYDSLYQRFKEIYRALRGVYRRINQERFAAH
ncbi:MAG: hypothetical protein H5T59_01250 [Anaerolineae bacterium]|nr:hypothetical protein [Anaerolineae bacterium]